MSEEQENYDAGPAEMQEPKPTEEQAKGTAVATQEAKPTLDAGDRGYIVPRTLDESFRYAKWVVAAGLAPNSYDGDAGKVMLGIASALEAGLPPLYGLRNIAIINGRPTIWGDAAIALVQRAGLIANQKVQEIGPSFDRGTPRDEWPDDFGYKVLIWRRGQEEPYVGTFTIGEAKKANLWNKRSSPWITYPLRMLLTRARTWALRDGFSDALAGLYIREEVEDYPEEPIERQEARTALLTDDTPDEAPEENIEDATFEPEQGSDELFPGDTGEA